MKYAKKNFTGLWGLGVHEISIHPGIAALPVAVKLSTFYLKHKNFYFRGNVKIVAFIFKAILVWRPTRKKQCIIFEFS